jgi:hypothetical protein
VTSPGRDLVAEGIIRANRLGWRTLTLRRLRRLAAGDTSALPPDPATASRRLFGAGAGHRWTAERAARAGQPPGQRPGPGPLVDAASLDLYTGGHLPAAHDPATGKVTAAGYGLTAEPGSADTPDGAVRVRHLRPPGAAQHDPAHREHAEQALNTYAATLTGCGWNVRPAGTDCAAPDLLATRP